MFDIFDLLAIISELIEEKSKKLGHVFDTIVGHIFMTIITGGLWIPIQLYLANRKRRKNKRDRA